MTRFPKYKEPIMLNIGCGKTKLSGFINIDNRDLGDNMVWDITSGIPFPDNSVDKIVTSHFIEHLTDEQSEEFLREAIRVLKPKGQIINIAPLAGTSGSYFFGHKTFWNGQKVESLVRLDNPIGKFIIIENAETKTELLFKLQKV